MIRGYLRPMVLKALKQGCITGYDLVKYIAEKTRKKPSYGSMYPLIEQLEKEKLLTSKEENKKKILCLTKKGLKEVEKIEKNKNEMLNHLEEAIDMFSSMFGTESAQLQIQMIKQMREGKIEIEQYSEMNEMKNTIMKIMLSNPNKKKIAETNSIIKKNTKELKKIMNNK